MPRDPAPPTPAKPKRGRPFLPPDQRGRKLSVYLSAAALAHCSAAGDGNAAAGARKLLDAATKRKRT